MGHFTHWRDKRVWRLQFSTNKHLTHSESSSMSPLRHVMLSLESARNSLDAAPVCTMQYMISVMAENSAWNLVIAILPELQVYLTTNWSVQPINMAFVWFYPLFNNSVTCPLSPWRKPLTTVVVYILSLLLCACFSINFLSNSTCLHARAHYTWGEGGHGRLLWFSCVQ